MGGTVNSIYNNLSFALNLQTDTLFRLQEQASTGSRINRASDDPSAAYRVLGLNSQVRTLESYADNIERTLSTLEISLTVIGEMISALADAKVAVSQITSGIYGEDGRATAAEGINDTLEQMVSLANTQHLNEYLFGGGNTGSAPYSVVRTDGKITSVAYQGSYENREVEVAAGVRSSAFYIGDEIFCSNDRSELVFVGDTGAQAGTGTSSVRGDTWLTVTGSEGNYSLSIDDGLTTVSTDGTDTNLAVTDSRTGQVLYVDTTTITAAGVDLVRAPGTYDVFETLIYVRDILSNEKGLSDTQVEELCSSSMESLEEIRDYLTEKSVSVGSKIGFLEVLANSIEDMKFVTEDETMMLEEADIAQIAIDIAREEILYEMSLAVAGSLMSMSLLDFIG
ncbi:MAG TPA: flagellar hook-associated protein FlgL [Sedimentisphaerales bacterium]|nr:flagellar hook-associated protein FlgL [Sedimentisphaerales bacterium]